MRGKYYDLFCELAFGWIELAISSSPLAAILREGC